jgi:hypothetical protein
MIIKCSQYYEIRLVRWVKNKLKCKFFWGEGYNENAIVGIMRNIDVETVNHGKNVI